MRALIYDTDRLRLATLAHNLQDMELEWVAVTSPEKIKAQMAQTQFDLMILDESAIDRIRAVRELDPGVPIIIAVDHEADLDYEQLFFEGVEGIITRPYRLDFFKKIVDKALAQRKHTLLHLKTVASLQQKVRELETLNEIVQAISSSLQPKEILDIIMEKTAELIKAEGWSLLLLDQEKQELVFEAAAGEAGRKLLGMRLRVGQGVAGWVAHYGQSIIVPDVTKDPRFYAGVDKKTKFVTKSILCVPMKSRDKIIGVVEVVNKIGGEPFTNDDLEIFENLVAHVTIALHNATLYRKMEEASLIDDLTQLYNNRYCKEYLDRYLNKRKDTQFPLSLIFMDIDYFKLVDDNFGHLVGSETLRYVGERIRRTVRTCDVVVRYGGDEYIVILPNTNKTTAAVIAERIRKEIKQDPFYAFGNKKFSITVTSGIATYPLDAKTRDELIGAADKAMYEGKLSGRDKVVLA